MIHSEVFGGFAGAACGHRIADSQSKILVTMDAYYRNGQLIDHKEKADEAIAAARKEGVEVEKVLVWRRHPGEYGSQSPMVEGRDFFVDELLEDYRGKMVEPVSMPAEAPLFLMYTSGTTGRPKGCEHSTGGYLSYVTGTSKYYQDIHPDDTYWCFADIGWITGHSYIVYGPLALGTTSVMYEGVPVYPDAGRPWWIAQKLGVNIFHTAPTTIRMLRKLGPEEPGKYDYHFKTMTTVGEPIEPDVWRWYHAFVGKGEAAITDTWWQTENGGFLGSTLPGLQPMKPGSCGPGVLGIHPVIYDENGDEVAKGSGKAGNICIRNPWPGSFQTIWGQPERYIDTYYAKYNRNRDSTDWHDWPDFAGDGAVQAADGYFRILGRVDDVINVAGHRLGTKELESASITVEEIAEAAAVPVIDDIRGRIVEMYVALKPGFSPSSEIQQKVSDAIDREIGKIARPKNGVDRRRHAEDALRQDHAPGDREHLQLRRRRRHHDARQPRDRRRDPPPRTEREARARRDTARALRTRKAGDRRVRPSGVAGRGAGPPSTALRRSTRATYVLTIRSDQSRIGAAYPSKKPAASVNSPSANAPAA